MSSHGVYFGWLYMKRSKEKWLFRTIKKVKHKFLICATCTAAFILLCFCTISFLYETEGILDFIQIIVTLAVFILTILVAVSYILRPYALIMQLQLPRSGYSYELLSIMEERFKVKERDKSYQLLQKQAQINALQQQINPHFLYNALDSVRGLAYSENATLTAEMVEALAIFFRYTIGGKNDLVSLKDELYGIRNYLKIQQYRYAHPIRINYQIDMEDDRVLATLIPRLTLQPIVENAIKHGLLHKKEDAEILIKLTQTQSRLIICIIDNGCGISDEKLRKINEKLTQKKIENDSTIEHGSGIALQNVDCRIKLHFGDNYGLTVYSTVGIGTQVEITIPLLAEKNNE